MLVCAKTPKDAAEKFFNEIVKTSGRQLSIGPNFSVCMLGSNNPIWFTSAPYLKKHGYHEKEAS